MIMYNLYMENALILKTSLSLLLDIKQMNEVMMRKSPIVPLPKLNFMAPGQGFWC